MRDRHGRPLGSAQDLYPGIELLRERLDDAGAEPGSGLGKGIGSLPDSIVRNRQLQLVPATSYATVIR